MELCSHTVTILKMSCLTMVKERLDNKVFRFSDLKSKALRIDQSPQGGQGWSAGQRQGQFYPPRCHNLKCWNFLLVILVVPG